VLGHGLRLRSLLRRRRVGLGFLGPGFRPALLDPGRDALGQGTGRHVAGHDGAGTITANYDGQLKHRTVIGDRAFIGSDTILRAPITIGEDAMTGAGSVVTKDVPQGKLAVGVPARIRSRRAQPTTDGV